MRVHDTHRAGEVALAALLLTLLGPFAFAQTPPARIQVPVRKLDLMVANPKPTLTLVSTCGSNVTISQICRITVRAEDGNANLANVDLNWNDGTPVERKAVTGNSVVANFYRSFTTARTINWTSTAYDATGAASATISGSFTVAAPPPPSTPPSTSPSPAPTTPAPAATGGGKTATTERELAPLVVMIRGKLAESSVVGAGVIFGIFSDRLYIVTANHVVRQQVLGGENIQATNVQVQLNWLRGDWQPATIVEDSFDRSLDLAVLWVKGAKDLAVPPLPWASFVRPDSIATGERVVPMGYPGGMLWFVPKQPHLVSNVGPQVIRTEGDLVPGYSGGALTSSDWGIAGIVQNIGSVLSDSLRIDIVLQQLRDWGHTVDATFKDRVKPGGD